MVLRAMLCSGGRLGLRTSGYGLLPLAARRSQIQRVSLQLSPLLINGAGPAGVVNARNFWWSRSPAPEPNAPAIPASPAPTQPLETGSNNISMETATQVSPTPTDEAVVTSPASDALVTATTDSASSASELINVIPPLQHGDLYDLGLVSWFSPAGWVRYSMEVLHVTTGMPWFYVIVVGTIAWRLASIPLTIVSSRNASRLRPFAAQMKALDEKAEKADQAEKLEIMLRKKQMTEKAGVTVLSSLGAPLAQITLQFALFLGVKGMVTLPVAQLRDSGVWFLPDLTVAGPYYIMPLVVAGLANLQLSLQKRDMDPSRPEMAHALNVFRVLTFAFTPFMAAYPDGLWLSVAAGLVVSLIQSRLLQVPSIGTKFGIIPLTNKLSPIPATETFRLISRHIQKMFSAGRQPPAQRLPKARSGRTSRR
ncbi:60Kd inner membrane protein-domain-containing protein [Pisolithus marmoratus]|nr:60Kd inner membrane protein-domain-containing protein [Pisolithus marmoratus]